MITEEQIALIAERYGIGVTHGEPGEGGFVLDDTKKVYQSMGNELRNMFEMDMKKRESQEEEYSVTDGIFLLAA